MVVQNLVFGGNWDGSQVVAGMKTTFFGNFDPTRTHILAPKGPKKELIKQHFSF